MMAKGLFSNPFKLPENLDPFKQEQKQQQKGPVKQDADPNAAFNQVYQQVQQAQNNQLAEQPKKQPRRPRAINQVEPVSQMPNTGKEVARPQFAKLLDSQEESGELDKEKISAQNPYSAIEEYKDSLKPQVTNPTASDIKDLETTYSTIGALPTMTAQQERTAEVAAIDPNESLDANLRRADSIAPDRTGMIEEGEKRRSTFVSRLYDDMADAGWLGEEVRDSGKRSYTPVSEGKVAYAPGQADKDTPIIDLDYDTWRPHDGQDLWGSIVSDINATSGMMRGLRSRQAQQNAEYRYTIGDLDLSQDEYDDLMGSVQYVPDEDGDFDAVQIGVISSDGQTVLDNATLENMQRNYRKTQEGEEPDFYVTGYTDPDTGEFWAPAELENMSYTDQSEQVVANQAGRTIPVDSFYRLQMQTSTEPQEGADAYTYDDIVLPDGSTLSNDAYEQMTMLVVPRSYVSEEDIASGVAVPMDEKYSYQGRELTGDEVRTEDYGGTAQAYQTNKGFLGLDTANPNPLEGDVLPWLMDTASATLPYLLPVYGPLAAISDATIAYSGIDPWSIDPITREGRAYDSELQRGAGVATSLSDYALENILGITAKNFGKGVDDATKPFRSYVRTVGEEGIEEVPSGLLEELSANGYQNAFKDSMIDPLTGEMMYQDTDIPGRWVNAGEIAAENFAAGAALGGVMRGPSAVKNAYLNAQRQKSYDNRERLANPDNRLKQGQRTDIADLEEEWRKETAE